MGKTIIIFRGDDGTPIADSISVTATQTFAPYTVYNGTIIATGNNNGSRVFTNCVDGDYNIKYDAVLQSDLNPLHISGPAGTGVSTIGQTSITATNIQDGAIGENQLADLAVTADKLANNAVTASKISSGAVDGSGLADGSVIKSKLGSSVFNSNMEDSSGWGPRYDGVTISISSGELYIPAGGVDTTQLADLAVTTAKIEDGAVTTAKLGTASITGSKVGDGEINTDQLADSAITTDKITDDAITQDKIYPNAVGTNELEDDSITTAKIAPANITATEIQDSTISIEKLSTSLSNSMTRFPTNVAYVSPEFSDNVSPYFDNLDDAYTDVDDNQGTIILYPGTYTTQLTMGDSVNIIGTDKLRCIVSIDPPAATPYGIKLTATSKDVLYKGFTLKVEPSSILGVTTYGIWLDDPGSNWIRMEDLLLKVQTAAHVSASIDTSIGFYINGANFIIQNCLVQAYGGNYGTLNEEGDVQGVYLIGTTVGTLFNSQFAIRNSGSGSNFSHGVYWTDTNQDVIVDNCTIEVTDSGAPGAEYSFAAGSAVTPLVMGTLYSKSDDANVTITSVDSTQSSDVVVRGKI